MCKIDLVTEPVDLVTEPVYYHMVDLVTEPVHYHMVDLVTEPVYYHMGDLVTEPVYYHMVDLVTEPVHYHMLTVNTMATTLTTVNWALKSSRPIAICYFVLSIKSQMRKLWKLACCCFCVHLCCYM